MYTRAQAYYTAEVIVVAAYTVEVVVVVVVGKLQAGASSATCDCNA